MIEHTDLIEMALISIIISFLMVRSAPDDLQDEHMKRLARGFDIVCYYGLLVSLWLLWALLKMIKG